MRSRYREREKEKPDLVEAVEPAVVTPVAVAAPDLAHLLASSDLTETTGLGCRIRRCRVLSPLLSLPLSLKPLNPPLKAAIATTIATLVVEHCTGLTVLADLLKFNCMCVVKQEGWGQLYGGLAPSLMGTTAS
ncbi:hypothetical protein Q3G72_029918 [Acer saccharum]|nr:hypothetical protein Q3G72_029918 [Acer saccharum]